MSTQLQKKLLPRHVQMMALGGAIGTGIFQGSSETISAAGPGVVIAYLAAGGLLFIVMSALAEMGLAMPGLDLRGFIHRAFGYRTSFVVGWLYFTLWIIVMALEIVAAGTFLHYWFHHVPVWMLSLLSALFIIIINLFSVRLYGEIEYWLTGIKVITLVTFIFLSGALIFGFIPVDNPPSVSNLTAHGGFMPLGWMGVFSSLLVVIFSYGGTELVGLTITEMKDADKTLPNVLKGVIFRICIFYALPILLITMLVPWNEVGNQGSPFVQVLTAVGMKGVAHVMNFIMLTAVISAANSGMYATSRMIYSLSKDGEAPALFTRVNQQGVPVFGLMISVAGLLLGSVAAFIAEDSVFQYLMGIPGLTTLLLWILICLAQLKLRSTYAEQLNYRVAFFPYLTGLTIVTLLTIFAFMLADPKNLVNNTIFFTVVIMLILISLFIKREPKPQTSQ
ncbi:amino acid permease [Laceyella putida]|uniref:Amino acid permease n=1 Tax=Laceyella putida TaxID=110101 RepID=A0ABW2RMU5_9BACL